MPWGKKGGKKDFVRGFIAGVLFMGLIFGFGSWMERRPPEIKHFIHTELNKEVAKKSIVEISYPTGNVEQEKLAKRILEVVDREYEIIGRTLGLKQEEILPFQTYGFVLCENFDDPLLTKLKDGLISIDGVLCWPVVSERGFPFRDPVLRFRLCYTLPVRLVKEFINSKLEIDNDSGGWFAEGISGYIAFLCWQALDKHGFLNYEYPRVLNLYQQGEFKKRKFNLMDRRSFFISTSTDTSEITETFADYIFYPASTFFIIDLVKKHGFGVIPEILDKLAKEKGIVEGEEIVKAIESLTGEDVAAQLENISAEDTRQRFKMLKKKVLSL